MTFFHPWAFGFGGLIPVIVALYLLKVRRRPLAISTLMFWQRVLQDNQRRALFQRLRQWLSLLLHLLIFALVLLALAKPALDRAVHEGSSTVLILDNRARMQAVEADGETRFEKARRLAFAYARQAGPSRLVAVESSVEGEAPPLGFSGDEAAIAERLRAFTPIDGGGALQDAVRLANDLLGSRAGEKRVLVFTDRVEPGVKAEFVTVGQPRDNVAITRFATRPIPASPETTEILLEVANYAKAAWSGSVEVLFKGQRIDERPFTLAPGEKKSTVFSRVFNERSGRLEARLPGTDALALDNTAWALVSGEPPRRVLLVTKGNWFLEKFLAADLRIRFELLAPDAYQPEMARSFEAVILDDLPAGPLPAEGNFLYLRQSPFSAPGAEITRPLVTDFDSQHPILRQVSLESVSFARAQPMALKPDGDGWHFEAPLRFGEQPLLIAGERKTSAGKNRVAAFGFSMTDSDLPLRIAFPLMMASTIQWLTDHLTEEMLVLKAGESLGVRSFLKNGIVSLGGAGRSAFEVAINTFDERESDLRLAGGETPGEAPRTVQPRWSFSLGGWPLWPWLAGAAALLFCGEWWLFHRRRTE